LVCDLRSVARLVPLPACLTRAAQGPGLSVAVDKVFRFEALGAAFDYLQSGKAKGRVVLKR
jgi:hypothetical protein